MNLLQLEKFVLNSGKKSHYKIECDAFTDKDWQTAAWLVAQTVGFFSSVEGVPRGGLKLASALQRYCIQPHEDYEPVPHPHLIVDDVLTAGCSIGRAKAAWLAREANPADIRYRVVGAVVFARGPCPPWVKAICQLPEELWDV